MTQSLPAIPQTALLDTLQRSFAGSLPALTLRGVEAERLQPPLFPL